MSLRDKKYSILNVRFWPHQKEKITRRANELGVSEAEYVRRRIDADKK